MAQEIFGLDDLVLYQMFHLECHDIKRGLIAQAQTFADTIVNHLADLHRKENARCVQTIL